MKKLFCILLAVGLLLSLCACTAAPAAVEPVSETTQEPSWQTQYDLGVRYLSEGNYQEAILAFNAAIEIDPKQPELYLKLAQTYEQMEDYEKTLQTLGDGLEQTDDQGLREYIWQVKVSLLEKPGAIEGAALDGTAERVVYDPSRDDPFSSVSAEGYTRSVLLALDDVTPAVFRFVVPELALHRYCVLPDGQIEDTAYQMDLWLEYCSCAELMLYYNERLGSYCCAFLNDISLAYTGVNGYYATVYVLDDTEARLYREWDQTWLIWDDKRHTNNISDMISAGWPYKEGIIENWETLPYCYWMFKCDSWVSSAGIAGGESAAEWCYSQRYWSEEELEAYEKEIRGEPKTPDVSKAALMQEPEEQAAEEANTELNRALLGYIASQPDEKVADSALKLVDAYVDMLNSTDAGAGIFYPDETDTDRFWTAIYLFEVNERKYYDANGYMDGMIQEGYLVDSHQNVQDIANAMYGKTIDIPPLDERWSVQQRAGDDQYYFGLSDRGAVKVVLDAFEQTGDGHADLQLSYVDYPTGELYLTANAELAVNPNVNLDGEIPFYYMIESVEIRYW